MAGRLGSLDRAELDDEQRSLLEVIESGRGRAGIGLAGPFGVWVRQPHVGRPAQALGAAVRFATDLPENVKEVAICTVGAHFRSSFEFAAHRRLAMAAGVDEAALDRLRSGDPPGLHGDEALAHDVTAQLLGDHRIRPDTYATALDALGEQGTIELVTIVGYYCLVSLTLNAFEIPVADDMDDPFPQR